MFEMFVPMKNPYHPLKRKKRDGFPIKKVNETEHLLLFRYNVGPPDISWFNPY